MIEYFHFFPIVKMLQNMQKPDRMVSLETDLTFWNFYKFVMEHE